MDDTELASEIRRIIGSSGITDSNLVAAIRILVLNEFAENKRRNLAHQVSLVRPKGQAFANLYVDGVLFPWYTADGFHVDIARSDIPNVTLTLRAETLTVQDEWLSPDNHG